MSNEQIDKIREKIDDLLWSKCLGDTAKIRNQILSIKLDDRYTLKIVDNKAEPPLDYFENQKLQGSFQVVRHLIPEEVRKRYRELNWKKVVK